MSRWIILLRGVTPTGKNKVPMAPLRAALEAAGLRDVSTYIQSGNVLVSTRLGQAKVERVVHDVIEDSFGGDLVVLARTPAYFRDALLRNPFRGAAPGQLYYTLLSGLPTDEHAAALRSMDFAPDTIALVDDMVYVRCATKYSDIKPHNNFLERKLKLPASTRVHNTIAKLVELAGAD